MRNMVALALLLALGAHSAGRYAPVEARSAGISPDDLAVSSGAAGAMLEQDYFRALQPADATGRVFLCRSQRLIFDKTRLAQSCN